MGVVTAQFCKTSGMYFQKSISVTRFSDPFVQWSYPALARFAATGASGNITNKGICSLYEGWKQKNKRF